LYYRSNTLSGIALKVIVRKGQFEKALRIFKRKTIELNLIVEARERMYYEKPSDRRRKRKKAAINRAKRDAEN